MPMLEKSKKHKKVSFSEDDAATLTHRYEATTVLTLLQEVAHHPHSKIDWNELVKKTSTGISNAREYQMLWRHLAYRDALPDQLEDGAQALDDDSDLECELEALPPVTGETALEAAACVKVMIASRTLSESTASSSTIEAPMTINVPVCHSSRTPNQSSQPTNLIQGTSIIFPVTVQRQTLTSVSSTEGIETKGSVGGNMAPKRKRKAWSEEEDMQLRAAVQRWGEGNWATMAKGDNFPIKRSPTQLAQRWTILRKKDGSTNSGTISTSTQYTAEQLATRHSLSLALDMPFKKLTAPGMTDPARTSFNTSIKNPVQPCNNTEGSTVHSNFVPPQPPSQQALLGSCSSPAKSKVVPEKPVLKCNPSPDPAVKATAVAAGARIVSPSDTVSQLKVAQARNAVHIVTAGSSLTKSSIPAGSPADPKVRSNVPHVCTGSSAKPVFSHSAVAVISPALCTSTVKAVSPTLEISPTALSILSEQDNCVTSAVNEVPLQQEINHTEEFKVSDPSPAPKERVQEDEALVMKNTESEEILEDKAVSKNSGGYEDNGAVKNSNFTVNMRNTEKNHVAVGSNPDNGRQDLDQDKNMNLPVREGGEAAVIKNTRSEENLEDKAVSQNPGESENQGTIKNSNFTVNMETTENHHIAIDSKLDKGRQDLDQDNETNLPVNKGGEYPSAINGSSEDQNTKEKQANLPSLVQDECSKGLELPS